MLAEVCEGSSDYEKPEMETQNHRFSVFGHKTTGSAQNRPEDQQKDKSHLRGEDASFAFLLLGKQVSSCLFSRLTFSKTHC